MMTLGATSLFISWVLLLITAWREEYTWGMFAVLLPPVAYGYALLRLDKAGASLGCALLGWILIWLGW